MKYQNILSAAFFLITLLLVACGEDGTTEKVTQVMQEGVQIVSELYDLPKCTKDNDGELMFVKGETSMRICSGGKWYATIEATSKSSCTTKALKDKKRYKYMRNYLEIMTTISSILLIKKNTEDSLLEKAKLWAYIKDRDKHLWGYLRSGIAGNAMNLPGKGGRKVSVECYKIAQKIFKFN